MGKTRVLILEKHAAFRRVLQELLAGAPDLEVIGEIEEPLQASAGVLDLAPDVVLIDVNLGSRSGLDVGRSIKLVRAETRIVFLSEETGKAYQQAIGSLGMVAVVRKSRIVVELIPCIRQLGREGRIDEVGMLSPEMNGEREGPPQDPPSDANHRKPVEG